MSREYTEAEQAAFVPPGCPMCGSPVDFKWVGMSGFGVEPTASPHPLACTNAACEMSDPPPRPNWGPEWDAATD